MNDILMKIIGITFQTVEEAINKVVEKKLSEAEILTIIDTFAHHEIGYIPTEYVDVLHKLSESYILAVVIDIWAPKITWLTLFEEVGIDKLFYCLIIFIRSQNG